jgi:hypothetical protein
MVAILEVESPNDGMHLTAVPLRFIVVIRIGAKYRTLHKIEEAHQFSFEFP